MRKRLNFPAYIVSKDVVPLTEVVGGQLLSIEIRRVCFVTETIVHAD